MKRIGERFLEKIQSVIHLKDLHVLEIGCGEGDKTALLAQAARSVDGIDPDATALNIARKKAYSNVSFHHGHAEALPFPQGTFDVSCFLLSLHHVARPLLPKAIQEAIRVTKPLGYVIFLEPGFHGTLFEAEKRFGAGDGDERKAKAQALAAILEAPLDEVAEFWDETIFQFDSLEDFISSMDSPNRSKDGLETFLKEHNYTLNAERRINIFRINDSSRTGS